MHLRDLDEVTPGMQVGLSPILAGGASGAKTPRSELDDAIMGAMLALINAFFEERVEQLFELAGLVERIFSSAGLEYRVVGGVATYLYVEEVEPDAGRLTKDVDIAVRRADLEKIAKAAESFGLKHRHVAGVDMLVRPDQPSARRAIHLVFAGEKVRPEDPEPIPELGISRRIRELRLIPLASLIRMKLTSFRAKDEAHLKDLDEAGLITPEIETGLSPILAERLARTRARG
jgi:hypothetical protein